MRILAIDTALGSCGACVLDAGSAEPLSLEQAGITRGHAEALMPLIARVMAKVPGGFASLDRVATTVGPGSFTGLRVGVSAAKAIGLATGRPVVGVSTLSAYCAPMMGREGGRLVTAAIDALHGYVYAQVLNPDGRPLAPAAAMAIRDVVRLIGAGPVNLVGSGALAVAQQAWAIGLDALVIDANPGPDLRWVARLGMVADPSEARPVPLYLKPPEARAQDGGRIARV